MLTPEQKNALIEEMRLMGGENIKEAREDLNSGLKELRLTISSEERTEVLQTYLDGIKKTEKVPDQAAGKMPEDLSEEPPNFIPDDQFYGYATNHDGRVLNWLKGQGRQVGKVMKLQAEWNKKPRGKPYFRMGYKLNGRFAHLHQLLINRNKALRAQRDAGKLLDKASGLAGVEH